MMYLPMLDAMYWGNETYYLTIVFAQMICFERAVNPYKLVRLLYALMGETP